LTNKPPSIPTKRCGEERLAKEVDDICALIAYLDESGMVSSLPKYVSDDPDGMPSSRLYEGDLHSLLAHMSKMDQKVAIFGDKLNVVVQHLHTYASNWPPLGAGTSGPSARSAETSTPSHTGTTCDRHDKQQASSADWATAVDELGVHNDDGDGGQWQLVQPSPKRRRRSQSQRQQQHAAEVHRSSVQFGNAPNVVSTVVTKSMRPSDRTTDQRSSTSRTSIGGGDGHNINNQQQQ